MGNPSRSIRRDPFVAIHSSRSIDDAVIGPSLATLFP